MDAAKTKVRDREVSKRTSVSRGSINASKRSEIRNLMDENPPIDKEGGKRRQDDEPTDEGNTSTYVETEGTIEEEIGEKVHKEESDIIDEKLKKSSSSRPRSKSESIHFKLDEADDANAKSLPLAEKGIGEKIFADRNSEKIQPEILQRDVEEFFTHIGLDKNTPFTEKDMAEFEKDLDYEDKKPKDRILYVPAKRFSNFNYHYVLNTYVPFTADLSHMNLISLDGIEFLYFISYLNLSNNLLKENGLKYLEAMEDLIALLLEKNKLTSLTIPSLSSLMLLDMSKNEISWIHDGLYLPNLESLILNYYANASDYIFHLRDL